MKRYFLCVLFAIICWASVSGMSLTSSAFVDGGLIPQDYTCDGKKYSPPLSWTGLPKKTKSLALVVDDPDVVTEPFVHWIVYNILPIYDGLPEQVAVKEISSAVEGTNSGGNIGYTSPCPPSGTHRYVFKLYALDVLLDLKDNVTAAQLNKAMQGHILAHATLMGRYGRQVS